MDVPQELGELQGLRELHLQVKLSTEDCKTITCLLKRTLDWDNQCWTWCSDHHAKKIKVWKIKWSSSCSGKPADGATTKSGQPRLPQFPLYSQARQQSLGELSPVDFGKDWHRFAITLIPLVTKIVWNIELTLAKGDRDLAIILSDAISAMKKELTWRLLVCTKPLNDILDIMW